MPVIPLLATLSMAYKDYGYRPRIHEFLLGITIAEGRSPRRRCPWPHSMDQSTGMPAKTNANPACLGVDFLGR